MNLKKTRGIYSITQISSGKRYIGSTYRNFYDRFCSHKAALRRGRHSSILLQRAWDKYGESDFKFEVLEVSDADLGKRELEYIKLYKSYDPKFGFNISRETSNCRLGHQQSLSSRKKISRALTGIKRSEHTIEKMRSAKSGHNNPMFGTKQSKELVERRVSKRRRPVVRCDGKIYSSISEAARDIGSLPQVVSQALRRGCRARGYRFKYLRGNES